MSHPLNVNGRNIQIDSIPDKCPRCNRNIEPVKVESRLITEPSYLLQIVYQCASRNCSKLFISNYTVNIFDSYHGSQLNLCYRYSEPKTAETITFNEDINRISPPFQEIYNQALTAESLGLTEICGAGYRKALEFLVKDYLIYKKPDQEDAFKRQLLGPCIRNIDDYNIKFCAERATWLGNDETHYTRKWDTQDLSDLKALINLMINWMTNELMMEKYHTEMAEGR